MLHRQKYEILKTIEGLRELGVEKVLPTHCTGELAIELFKENFGENFIDGGVGQTVKLL